jgi:hypothetical protein
LAEVETLDKSALVTRGLLEKETRFVESLTVVRSWARSEVSGTNCSIRAGRHEECDGRVEGYLGGWTGKTAAYTSHWSA